MTRQDYEAIALALKDARDTANTAPGTEAEQALVRYGVDQAARCIALLADNLEAPDMRVDDVRSLALVHAGIAADILAVLASGTFLNDWQRAEHLSRAGTHSTIASTYAVVAQTMVTP